MGDRTRISDLERSNALADLPTRRIDQTLPTRQLDPQPPSRSAGSDRQTVERIRALVRPRRALDRLPPSPPREAIAARTGIGEPKGLGAGIASPLVEPDYLRREYYETPQYFTSSDGLFVIEQAPIFRVYMVDANGEEVVLEFAEPVQPPSEE